MKKTTLSLMLSIVLLSFATEAAAQRKATFDAGADFVSNYMWRGYKLGNFSMQPYATLGYGRFSLNAWGSTGFSDTELLELDLTLTYHHKGFSLSLSDFWYSYPGSGERYFDYFSDTSIHVYQAEAGYDFGFMSLSWATIFAGNDGVNDRGERAYTSYATARIPFSILGFDCTASVGATPWGTSYLTGTDGPQVCELGMQVGRTITIPGLLSIPLHVSATYNPVLEKSYMVVGLSLR